MRVFIYYVLKESKAKGQCGRDIVLSVFENVDNEPIERMEVKINTAGYRGFENEICRELERCGRIEKAPSHYMNHKAEEYGFKVVAI
jgi:hypothetical protein